MFRQLDAMGLQVPAGEVAVTAGSRGIDRIPDILRAVGDWLRARGAQPFLVPCMGSHGGATEEGQRAMLEGLGMTPAATGMAIRSSMDVVKVGAVSTGDVWIDRHCHEAAGVLLVNRIKLHTAFAGPLQSGLVKMMVVGMGKAPSARTFHSATPAGMAAMLPDMARCLLATGKGLGGLAILEDGYDRVAELHGVRADALLAREPELLERHRRYFPSLPADQLNVLVVDSIGKDLSGTGMDTNVIGFRGIRSAEDLPGPRIEAIAALNLSARSQGNAIGIGLADVVTRRLRDAMDEAKTFANVFTTGAMRRMAIPCTLRDDAELVARLRERYGDARWLFIPDTLHLGTLYATEDLASELAAHPRCAVEEARVALSFNAQGRHQLDFASP